MQQGQIHERIVEEIIEVSVSRVMEKIIEGVRPISQERVQDYTVEQIVAVPVPQIPEQTKQVTQLIPQDRMSDDVVEQIVDAHVRQIGENIVEVVRVMPQERLQQRTQAKDPPAHITQKTVYIPHTLVSEIGLWSQTVPDRMVGETKRCQDKDEVDKVKIDAKNGFKNCWVTMENTVSEDKHDLKFEARDMERAEKAVRDDRNWLDKNRLAENDEFEAQQEELEEVPADMMTSRQVPAAQIMQKTCENPQVQSMDMVVNMPAAAQHQVPTVQRVETTVGGPKVQFINEVMDVPAVKQ